MHFSNDLTWGAATVAGKAPRQSEEPKTGCQREPTARCRPQFERAA